MAQVEVIDYQINGILEATKQAKSFKEQMELVRKELSIKAPGLKYTEKELENLTRATVNLGKGLDNAADKGNKFARNLKEAFRNIGKEALSEGDLKGGLAGIAGGIIGGGIVGAIGTVVDLASQAASAFYNWATAEDEVQRASREMSEAIVQASAAFADEAVALDSNFAILSDTTMSYEDRQLALNELNEAYPEYFGNIDLDKVTNEELEVAYANANNQLQKRIELQANTEIATKKYTEAIEKQQQAMQQLENIGDISNNTWTDWLNIALGVGNQVTVNAQKVGTLTAESKKANAVYEEMIKKLKELNAEENKRQKELDDAAAKAKAKADAEKEAADKAKEASKQAAEERKKTARETAQDFYEANRFAIEASEEGAIEESEILLQRAEAYRNLAAEAAKAAKDIGDTGKSSNKELKDQIADATNLIDANKNSISAVLSQIELFGKGVRKLSNEQQAAAQALLQDLTKKALEQGGSSQDIFDSVFKQLVERGFIIVDDQVKKAFGGAGNTLKDLLKKSLIPSAEIIRQNENLITENQNILDKRRKQEEAAGANIAEYDRMLAETRLKVQQNLAKRKEEADKKLAKSAVDASEAVARGIINSNKAEYEALVQANIDIAEANLIQGVAQLEAKFRDAVKDISGLEKLDDVLDFTEARGFFLKDIELEQETKDKLIDIVRLYNQQRSQLEATRDAEVLKARIKATKQLINQTRTLNEDEFELERERIENRKFALEDEKNIRLKAIKELRDPLLKAGKDLTDEQIAQAKQDGERFAAEARKIAEDEAAALTGPFFEALEKAIESGDAQAAQEALLQFINQRNAILKAGNDQAEVIQGEFSIIPNKKTQEEKLREIMSLAVQYAQQIAELINNIFELVAQKQQNVVDSIQEQLDAVSAELDRTVSKINELEGELADERSGRRDAVLRGIENEKQREEVLIQQKIRLAQRLAAEEKRLANIKKGQAISQAIINGALAITQSFAQLGPIAGAIAAVITAATTATQIALIAQQKFAKGGYTGKGSGNKDETGYKVAGVVHEGEYVVPKWMVESPKYSGTIASLESARTGAYADGGFTTANYSSLSDSAINKDNIQLARIMTKYAETNIALAERPLFVTATEVTRVSSEQARRVNATSIGG